MSFTLTEVRKDLSENGWSPNSVLYTDADGQHYVVVQSDTAPWCDWTIGFAYATDENAAFDGETPDGNSLIENCLTLVKGGHDEVIADLTARKNDGLPTLTETEVRDIADDFMDEEAVAFATWLSTLGEDTQTDAFADLLDSVGA